MGIRHADKLMLATNTMNVLQSTPMGVLPDNERQIRPLRYARYLLRSTAVVENISTGTMVPVSERQVRPLTKLEPEQQKEAWQR
jgi:hypothetical protein